jgi:hypothetical protein
VVVVEIYLESMMMMMMNRIRTRRDSDKDGTNTLSRNACFDRSGGGGILISDLYREFVMRTEHQAIETRPQRTAQGGPACATS